MSFERQLEIRVTLSTAEREALIAAQAGSGLSWKLVCRDIGISVQELSHWRRGERRPTSEQLTRWWAAVSQNLSVGAEHEPSTGDADVLG